MDEVLQFDTRTSTATMEVIDARRTRSYRMKSYARGQDSAGARGPARCVDPWDVRQP